MLTEGESMAGVDMMFDRLLLIDARRIICQFDADDFDTVVTDSPSPPLILQVLKAVTLLTQPELSTELTDWNQSLTV